MSPPPPTVGRKGASICNVRSSVQQDGDNTTRGGKKKEEGRGNGNRDIIDYRLSYVRKRHGVYDTAAISAISAAILVIAEAWNKINYVFIAHLSFVYCLPVHAGKPFVLLHRPRPPLHAPYPPRHTEQHAIHVSRKSSHHITRGHATRGHVK